MPKNKRSAYLPVIIMSALILTVSSIPGLAPPSVNLKIEDKIAHFAEYFFLGFFVGRAIWILRPYTPKSHLKGLGACALFAILDEIHQAIIPNRTTDILDMAADILGALIGILLAYGWYRRKAGSRETE